MAMGDGKKSRHADSNWLDSGQIPAKVCAPQPGPQEKSKRRCVLTAVDPGIQYANPGFVHGLLMNCS